MSHQKLAQEQGIVEAQGKSSRKQGEERAGPIQLCPSSSWKHAHGWDGKAWRQNTWGDRDHAGISVLPCWHNQEGGWALPRVKTSPFTQESNEWYNVQGLAITFWFENILEPSLSFPQVGSIHLVWHTYPYPLAPQSFLAFAIANIFLFFTIKARTWMNAVENLCFSYCSAIHTKICKNKSSTKPRGAETLAGGDAEYRKACGHVWLYLWLREWRTLLWGLLEL